MDRGAAVRSVAHDNAPRLAADLTVLDVFLTIAATGIEGDDVLLATIRADDGPGRVGRAITEWKLVVQIVVKIDHEVRPSTLRRMYMPDTALWHAFAIISADESGTCLTAFNVRSMGPWLRAAGSPRLDLLYIEGRPVARAW